MLRLILQEERLFSIAEVRQFLLLTGDTNPFHTCESAARAQGELASLTWQLT